MISFNIIHDLFLRRVRKLIHIDLYKNIRFFCNVIRKYGNVIYIDIYIEKVLKILNTGCKYYESITMDAQI